MDDHSTIGEFGARPLLKTILRSCGPVSDAMMKFAPEGSKKLFGFPKPLKLLGCFTAWCAVHIINLQSSQAGSGANRRGPWLSSGLDEREQAMCKLMEINRLFDGRRFDHDVIVLYVRWVKRFTPEFLKRWDRFAKPASRSKSRRDVRYAQPT